ncbi:hypothetical protein [Caloramator fervidus]|nr:hypothetical protein [Caloramator fervidus]
MRFRHKGYVLMEVFVWMFLISVMFICFFDMLIFNSKFYFNIIDSMDSRINTQIAMEFLIDKITNSKNISFQNGILYVDGKKIYLNKDVLIYEYGSTPVVDKIKNFTVLDLGNGLYEISVESKHDFKKIIIQKR